MLNLAKIDCNDLSTIAMFQSLVYGNDSLLLHEKRSFESVTSSNSPTTESHIPTMSMMVNPSNTPIPKPQLPYTDYYDTDNEHIQNPLHSNAPKCQHKRVTKTSEKISKSITMYYIECFDCSHQLYHYSSKRAKRTDCNKNILFDIKKETVRKDNDWYENIYLRCKHSEEFRENTMCGRCGQSVIGFNL
eukprot:284154_1